MSKHASPQRQKVNNLLSVSTPITDMPTVYKLYINFNLGSTRSKTVSDTKSVYHPDWWVSSLTAL